MVMNVELTKSQRQALEENSGFIDVGGSVIMSMEVYRQIMGVGTEEELAASLQAVEQGLRDDKAGNTRPYREVLAELGSDDGV